MKLNFNQFDDGGYVDSAGENVSKPIAPTPAVESAAETSLRDNAKAETATRMTAMRSPSALASQESGSIGATSIATRMAAMGATGYKEPGKGAGMKTAKAKTPVDKSGYDRSIKVPQSTVDAVKDAGRGNMGKVPQRIVKNDAIGLSAPGYVGSQLQYNAPVSKEYKEAVKRVYPKEVKTPRSPSFNESSPNAKPFPKIAAPKTRSETVKNLRNEEIYEANKQAPKNDQVAYAIINGLKAGKEAYGAGTQTRSQISGTQTKTQKAQADRRAEMAANKSAAASKPAAATGKIKVSQATVDSVKSQGKATAIKNAKSNVTNAEYKEAVKRIYQSPAKPKAKAKSGGGGGKASSAVK